VAKANGRNQIHIFSADSDERAVMDMELGWSARLETALKNNGFVLCYQPILPLAQIECDRLPEQPGALWTRYLRQQGSTQRLFYEILIRLRAPDGSLVSPNAFLPAAERFSLIGDIDRWVIRQAFQSLRDQNRSEPPMGLAINLSAQSLAQGDIGAYITDRLVEFDIDPRAVIFEITETGALNHVEDVRKLIGELKPFGCRFGLDDFGIGFSSFAHLKHLDVDFLKIDGSFVRELLNDPVDLAVISAITNIAHSIGKITIAEQVDRPEILRALHQCGVDQAQGFYIARPQTSLRAANGQLEVVAGGDTEKRAEG